PPTLEGREGGEPVYEEFEGFTEDISACRSFEELPEVCRKYISRLEELCECPVSMVGVGPDREQVAVRG
ncbi:MAG: adenylosuccinate synthetase, partial [Ruminococcus sp.]|nr:adenylosuccinate synthetase [Ruminococcus sp.]